MTTERTLSELRAEFCQARFLAMPIAGTILWTVAGALGAILTEESAAIALFCCLGAVFPVGMIIARFTGEDLFGTESHNDLDRLFGFNILMCNLVWVIAIPFWWIQVSSLPLSLGVLAGLMWVPFSWMIQHWVGLFHGITRTVLVFAVWLLFPEHRFVAVPAVVVVVYVITIAALAARQPPTPASPSSEEKAT